MASELVNELQVRGVDRFFGTYEHWPKTGPVKCDMCGSKKSPHWCEAEADFMQEFFRLLVLVDGKYHGEPFEPIDWVETALDVVWGVKIWDGDGWYRLIQDVIGNIIRGQMKSTFLRGVKCWWLRFAPRGYVAAFAQQTKDETLAKMVPGVLEMIELSPAMQNGEFSWISDSKRPGGGERFIRGSGRGEVSLRMVSAANAKTARGAKGPRYSMGCFDEVGFMGEPEILISEVVKKANLDVPDPLWFQFSTQSPDPAHYQRRECITCLDVEADPSLNPRLWPINLVSDSTVDVLDRETAINLGPLFRLKIAPESIIDQELAEAKLDAAKLNTYARERCGFSGDYSVRFVAHDDWMACAAKGGRAEILEKMKNLPVFMGCDFSETSDFSAICLFAVDHDGTVLAVPYHFIPSAARAKLDGLTRGKVGNWISDGWLEELPAGRDLPAKVGQRALDIVEPLRENIVAWGYDRWHATEAAILWRNAGWNQKNPDQVMPIEQGRGLNAPIKAAPRFAENRKLLHPGDPVFDYCALCAATEADKQDPDKVKFVKIERGLTQDRIDGVVAFATAWQMSLAWKHYESRQKPPPDWGAAAKIEVMSA